MNSWRHRRKPIEARVVGANRRDVDAEVEHEKFLVDQLRALNDPEQWAYEVDWSEST